MPEGGRESEISAQLGNPRQSFLMTFFKVKKNEHLNTFNRFVINSSVGLFGFGDPATDMGYPRHTEDFAQTLCHLRSRKRALYGVTSFWTINAAAYSWTCSRLCSTPFKLGILQNQNDGYRYSYGIIRSRTVAREELLDVLDDIEASSTDYYVSIRNMYMQRRLG